MVLLFWAHLFASQAVASSVNYGDFNKDGILDNAPKVVAGPRIQLLKDHFCTGEGKTLYLPREVLRNEAFQADQQMADYYWYEMDQMIWVGSLYTTWDDTTIFGDIPRNYELLRKNDVYVGRMVKDIALILDVQCKGGKAPRAYAIMEIPETTITVGQ